MEDTFGTRIKALRLERKLGQVELAKQLGVGKSVVSLWERDECEPTLTNLVAIARFFRVSIDFLVGIDQF